MIIDYSNEEIIKIYNQCKIAKADEKACESKYLLEVYNKLFDSTKGFLHYWMIQDVYGKVVEEIAERFATMYS